MEPVSNTAPAEPAPDTTVDNTLVAEVGFLEYFLHLA